MDKTIILAALTVACMIGLAVAEVLELEGTAVLCAIGFIISGIAVLFSVFDRPKEEEEDNPEDKEEPWVH